MTQKEKQIFDEYIRRKNLRHSARRDIILKVFLENKGHLTADELYRLTTEIDPGIGFATIYRTLKHLCKSGLSRELKGEDGISRYEHLYGRRHHDHLICSVCGKFTEVSDSRIEKLQEELAQKEGFTIIWHKLELYGICRKCKG